MRQFLDNIYLYVPVMKDIIGQVDEMQAELEVGRVGGDAVAEVRRHQVTVQWALGVGEHPVLPGLRAEGTKTLRLRDRRPPVKSWRHIAPCGSGKCRHVQVWLASRLPAHTDPEVFAVTHGGNSPRWRLWCRCL